MPLPRVLRSDRVERRTSQEDWFAFGKTGRGAGSRRAVYPFVRRAPSAFEPAVKALGTPRSPRRGLPPPTRTTSQDRRGVPPGWCPKPVAGNGVDGLRQGRSAHAQPSRSAVKRGLAFPLGQMSRIGVPVVVLELEIRGNSAFAEAAFQDRRLLERAQRVEQIQRQPLGGVRFVPAPRPAENEMINIS